MTDLPTPTMSVPSRLGVAARFVDGELIIDLTPQAETCRHGVVRASVLSFVIDAVAGILVDQDPDSWTFTSDMSVRMRPVPAPALVSATATIVRQGRRSVACTVELTADAVPFGLGAIGFVRIPRRDTDPPKPLVTPAEAPALFQGLGTLDRPLRDEAGVAVIDAAAGVVELEVTPGLHNPAGTLQGAMVALVAEVAAEELVTSRFGVPAVVTDLDLRYLGQARVGPVRTRTRLVGAGPDAAIQVELIDRSTDAVTTLVYARTAPAPAP